MAMLLRRGRAAERSPTSYLASSIPTPYPQLPTPRLLPPRQQSPPAPAFAGAADNSMEPLVPMIMANRQRLDALHAALQAEPLFDKRKHDDLFLLRYLLSYEPRGPDVSAAASAVRRSLSVRQIHKLVHLGKLLFLLQFN